jgi:hypothetical protein
MSKVTTVSYGRTYTGNSKQFENERLDVTVELQEGDTQESALSEAMLFVNSALGIKNIGTA